MINHYIIIIFVVAILCVISKIIVDNIVDTKKYNKLIKTIKVGDVYMFGLVSGNPWLDKIKTCVTVEEILPNNRGVLYIKYRYESGEAEACPLTDFIHYWHPFEETIEE